ncbi:MAG: hypothetical protein RIG26_17995 [Thalassospira sp.]|uniref:hypothetical protein n=1 Tax=Thalassospira sp. TaxID=1912094 RepID=UPI0032EC5637
MSFLKLWVFVLAWLAVSVLPAKAANDYLLRADDPIFAITQERLLEYGLTVSQNGFLRALPEKQTENADFSGVFSLGMAVKSFEYGVFGCKYLTPDCSPTTSLTHRWEEDSLFVHIDVQGAGESSQTEGEYRQLFDEVFQLAGIEVEFSDDAGASDIIVLIGDVDYFRQRRPTDIEEPTDIWSYFQTLPEQGQGLYGSVFGELPLGCADVVFSDSRNVIEKATVYALKPDAAACAAKMVFMSLGFNDNIQAVSSVLSHFGNYDDLTEIDKHLIKLLYGNMLEPGMKKSEVLASVRGYFVDNGFVASAQDDRFTNYIRLDDVRLNTSNDSGFEADADGYIVDGPRTTRSEPIDYSKILTSSYIEKFLESCGQDTCSSPAHKSDAKDLVYFGSCGKLGEKSHAQKFLAHLYDLTAVQGAPYKVAKEMSTAEAMVLIAGDDEDDECSNHPIYQHMNRQNGLLEKTGFLSERIMGRCVASEEGGQLSFLVDWHSLWVCDSYLSLKASSTLEPAGFLSTSFNPDNGYGAETQFDRCYFSANKEDIPSKERSGRILRCLDEVR